MYLQIWYEVRIVIWKKTDVYLKCKHQLSLQDRDNQFKRNHRISWIELSWIWREGIGIGIGLIGRVTDQVIYNNNVYLGLLRFLPWNHTRSTKILKKCIQKYVFLLPKLLHNRVHYYIYFVYIIYIWLYIDFCRAVYSHSFGSILLIV